MKKDIPKAAKARANAKKEQLGNARKVRVTLWNAICLVMSTYPDADCFLPIADNLIDHE